MGVATEWVRMLRSNNSSPISAWSPIVLKCREQKNFACVSVCASVHFLIFASVFTSVFTCVCINTSELRKCATRQKLLQQKCYITEADYSIWKNCICKACERKFTRVSWSQPTGGLLSGSIDAWWRSLYSELLAKVHLEVSQSCHYLFSQKEDSVDPHY